MNKEDNPDKVVHELMLKGWILAFICFIFALIAGAMVTK